MQAFRLTLLYCWLLTLAPSWVSASEHNSSADAFTLGVEQFRSGNLEDARESFEAARAGGLQSFSLIYNLGVVYYRLGQFDAAERTFRELLSTNNRVLASYNLGLVALARGNEASARDWFVQVNTSESPDKLRKLAVVQLEKLSADSATRRVAGGRNGYLAFSGGYDSNIAGLPETAASSKGGGFADVLAAGSVGLSARNADRLTVEGAAYARRYPSDGDFNSGLLQGTLAWSRNRDASLVGAAFVLSQSWFDADALERRYALEGFHRWRACAGPLGLARCSLFVALAQVSGGSEFEAYDGQWYRIGVSAVKRFGNWGLNGQYLWEVNDRRDFRVDEQFISVSPAHHKLELAGHYDLRPRLKAGWTGSVRYSQYRDSHTLLVDGALVTERRTDARIEVGLFLENRLDDRWLMRGEWIVQDNESSIGRYDYRRHTVMATLEGAF